MRKYLIVTTALVGAAYGANRWNSAPATNMSREHEARLTFDRVWCDHIPRSETDKMQIFAVLTQKPRRPPIGIFEQVSMWEGHFEAFSYEGNGQELRVVFPQSGDRETLTLKASKCNVAGMDYCLDVSGNSRGVQRYYSKRGWEIRDLASVPSVTDKLLAH